MSDEGRPINNYLHASNSALAQMEREQAAINSIANRGNVTLQAGEAYKQVGSDVIAPAGDIIILAKTVDIVEARERSSSSRESPSAPWKPASKCAAAGVWRTVTIYPVK